ncbi:MAG TPA: DUF1932 domain-containing protein [Steroidobacteraceae bacterium]
MKPVVAIVAQGGMASGLGARLTQHGVEVRTVTSGRSEASRARALAAGMKQVTAAELLQADVLLAVLPPAVALPFAAALAPQLRAAARKPLYVDCNAVSPETVRAIAAVITDAGADFVDVGIIGLPPRDGYAGPKLYASGKQAQQLSQLCQFGLQVRVLDGEVGAASALKMAYGGITKGLTAVGTAMILAATRAGLAEALERELAESEPVLREALGRRIPDMLPKAYRWVDEMRQISHFSQPDAAAAAIYAGAADLYERLANEAAGERREASALIAFFDSKGQLRRP